MRYTQTKLFLAALVGLLWAQQHRYGPLVTGKPDPEFTRRIAERLEGSNADRRGLVLVREDWGIPQGGLNLRTRGNVLGLTWLLPHQDADTVRKTRHTLPFSVGSGGQTLNVGGDTIIASGTGSDIPSSNIADPAACNHNFFDSLVAAGGYLGGLFTQGPHLGRVFYLIGSPLYEYYVQGDTHYYDGGGGAQRYIFNFAGMLDFHVKGIATLLLKNRFGTPTQRCQTLTTSYDTWDGDDVPEAVFFVANADTVTWPGLGMGTYVNQIIARETIRVQNIRYGLFRNEGQCILPESPNSDPIGQLTERLHYVYFQNPVRLGPNNVSNPSYKDSVFYFGFIFDRKANPVPTTPQVLDSIYGVVAPSARGFTPQTLPCRHDLEYYMNVGRVMTMDNAYSASRGWVYASFVPEPYAWGANQTGYLLDFCIFPIVQVTLDPNAHVGKPIVSNDVSSFSAPYPNPATDCVHLGVELATEGRVTMTFYDAKGQVIKEVERSLPAGLTQVAVDVGDLPAGAYILMARSSIGGGASFWINIVK